MADSSGVLNALLIPYDGGYMIMPKSAVIETLPYATPLQMSDAPDWVLGAFLWRDRKVPVISIEALTSQPKEKPDLGARMVLVRSTGAESSIICLAFVAMAEPSEARLTADDLQPGAASSADVSGILSRVMVQGEPGFIPDIGAIEAAIGSIRRI